MKSALLLLLLLSAQDENIKSVLAGLEGDDAPARSAAVAKVREMDDASRKALAPLLDPLATRVVKALDRELIREIHVFLKKRPAGKELVELRKDLLAKSEAIQDQSDENRAPAGELMERLMALFAVYYPDRSELLKAEACAHLRAKLSSVREAAELCASEKLVKRIRNYDDSLGGDGPWGMIMSPADAKVMAENEKIRASGTGDLAVDDEEYKFSVLLNQYRVMMGHRPVRLDLKLSRECRAWSRQLVSAGGALVHSNSGGENLMPARDAARAFWMCTADWPHHRQYFAAGRCGIGRHERVWTFRN